MIYRLNENASKPSFIPKFSDPDLIKAVINPAFWSQVFLGNQKAIWDLFKGLLLLKIEMFASPLRACLRYGHGRRTVGIGITFLTVTMLMAFNTEHLVGALATFFPLVAPIAPFFMSESEISDALFVDTRSEGLMYFWMAYLSLATAHLIGVYRRKGGAVPTGGRGTSILHTLVFRHIKVSEAVVQRLVEPILVGLTGHTLMHSGMDETFGLFLMIAAACLFAQEGYDAVMKFRLT